ncbi:hypothetical protein ACLB2K_065834 [Fragaria x ananassa]
MTASRGRDWGGPVFDSPMLKLAAKLGHFGLSLRCGIACYPLECLPFWRCFTARMTLASGLLPALYSLDAREGLARANSTG